MSISIYWTATTSFKTAASVTQGLLIPWIDFEPSWKGWRNLGFSPDTLFVESNPREEFLARFLIQHLYLQAHLVSCYTWFICSIWFKSI